MNDKSLIRLMVIASLASTIGGLPFNALPVMLGSLADSFSLAPQAIGLLGSICFAGYLLGTLGAPFWIDRVNWRLLTIISAAGTAASFAFSAFVIDLQALYIVWALIGFFASTMTCLGMRILGELPNKVRAFGFRQGTELTVTAAVLFALPPLVIAVWQYRGAALALAAVVAVLGLSALWLPARSAAVAPVEVLPKSPISLTSAMTMAVFFVFLTGNIGLWTFIERIGAAQAFAPAQMGLVFAVLKLLGGAAAFSVAIGGERLGPNKPYILMIAGVCLGLGLLHSQAGFAAFSLGTWIWEFAFTAGCVFQTAAIARSDSSGRAIMLAPAIFAFSSMVGPGLAGQLAAGGSFAFVLLLALVCSLVPVAYYLLRPKS
jgi:MFS family permease